MVHHYRRIRLCDQSRCLQQFPADFPFRAQHFIGVRHSIGILLEGAFGAGDGYILNNIWSRGKEGKLQGIRGDLAGHEGNAVNYAICGGAACGHRAGIATLSRA